MRPRAAGWRSLVGAVVLALSLGGGLAVLLRALGAPGSGDGKDRSEIALGGPARVAVRNGVVVLTLRVAEQRNIGIATARPVPVPAGRVAIGYGRILDAAVIAELCSRHLDAKSEVESAKAKRAVARAAFERAQMLHRDRQNISTAELQSAEGSLAVAEAALAAGNARLAAIAATVRLAWGNVLGTALIDRTPLIADLMERRDYLVEVTLPAGIAIVAPPPMATTRLNGGPEIGLHFVSPAPSVDPKLQGMRYFYKAAAASGLLPGLNLEVSLVAGSAEPGLIVPEEAVVWLQGKAWIFLRTAATTFERRELIVDRPAADGSYITNRLPAAAQIVVRGAQMLLSEEFRAQAPIED